MRIFRAYKTELNPNNVQRTLLAKSCGVARFTYNWGLGRRIEEYKNTSKSSNAIDQHKQLTKLNRDLNAAINLSKYQLPQVLGKVTPVESVAIKVPQRNRKKTSLMEVINVSERSVTR